MQIVSPGIPEYEQLVSLITLPCRPGKIAVDPTSDEDASVELNQSTQLGSSGTTGVNAYPKYADGTKVLSHHLRLLLSRKCLWPAAVQCTLLHCPR